MAAVCNSSYVSAASTDPVTARMPSYQRAQVIAWYDYVKSELPDVFFVQNDDRIYPLNFAGQPFPGSATRAPTTMPTATTSCRWGIRSSTAYSVRSGTGYARRQRDLSNPARRTGHLRRIVPVAAGHLQEPRLSARRATTAIDNNGNGLIDESAEGALGHAAQATVQVKLAEPHAHHGPVRDALRHPGRGQWAPGLGLQPRRLHRPEVQDTDGDGLPEFVDAWGQPLQFFRWPLLYHSDLQRGQVILTTRRREHMGPRASVSSVNSATTAVTRGSVFQEREQDPLDPNQQLTAPAWWLERRRTGSCGERHCTVRSAQPGPRRRMPAAASRRSSTSSTGSPSRSRHGGGAGFTGTAAASFADRRASYSKFLIVSGGPDKQPGVFLYSDAAMASAWRDNAAAA